MCTAAGSPHRPQSGRARASGHDSRSARRTQVRNGHEKWDKKHRPKYNIMECATIDVASVVAIRNISHHSRLVNMHGVCLVDNSNHVHLVTELLEGTSYSLFLRITRSNFFSNTHTHTHTTQERVREDPCYTTCITSHQTLTNDKLCKSHMTWQTA